MNGSVAMKIWNLQSLNSTEGFSEDLESILKLSNEKILKRLIEVCVMMVVKFHRGSSEIQLILASKKSP